MAALNQDIVETTSLICKSEIMYSEQIFPEPLAEVKTSNDVHHVWLQETKSVAEESDDVSTENKYIAEEIIKEKSIKYSKSDKIDMNSNEGYDANSSFSKKDAQKNIECCICNKRFLSTRGRTRHLKEIHSVQKAPPSPPYKCETSNDMNQETKSVAVDPPTYECKVCGKLFKRLQHLSSHEVVHLSDKERVSYDCPQCDKKFLSEKSVREHIRVVHKRDRPFICETCGSAFARSKNLKEHYWIHSDEKKFKCPKCEKTFKCKRGLKLHIDTHDDTEYFCQICSLKLNTKQGLRRHMVVHSDKTKYTCNFCSKEFNRQDNFKNHLILHTGLKPYECSFCTLTFSNGSNFKKHKILHHPLETANEESKGIKYTKNVPSIKQLKAVNEEVALKNNLYGEKIKNKSAAHSQAQQKH